MDIDTSRYEAEYGAKPRGKGIWFFTLTGPDRRTGTAMEPGLYNQARKAAERRARESGYTKITLEP